MNVFHEDFLDALADALALRIQQRLLPPPPVDVDEWLTGAQAAEIVKLSESRLEALRRNGGGPAFSRNGRRVRYRRSDIDKWLGARRQR